MHPKVAVGDILLPLPFSLWLLVTTQIINDYFVKELSEFKPRKSTLKIFRKLLQEEFGDQSRAFKGEHKTLQVQIKKLNGKLGKARELLLPSGDSGETEPLFRQLEPICGLVLK